LGTINVYLDATAQLLIIQRGVKNLKSLHKYKYLRFSFDSFLKYLRKMGIKESSAAALYRLQEGL